MFTASVLAEALAEGPRRARAWLVAVVLLFVVNAGYGAWKRPNTPYDDYMEAQGIPIFRGIGVRRVQERAARGGASDQPLGTDLHPIQEKQRRSTRIDPALALSRHALGVGPPGRASLLPWGGWDQLNLPNPLDLPPNPPVNGGESWQEPLLLAYANSPTLNCGPHSRRNTC